MLVLLAYVFFKVIVRNDEYSIMFLNTYLFIRIKSKWVKKENP